MRSILLASLLLLSAPVALAQDGAPEASQEAPEASQEAPEATEAPAPAPEADEAPAPAEVEEAVEGASDTASLFATAIQDKNWALVIGLLLSLLVAFANKFGLKDKVGGKAIPWVTSGVAVFGAVAAALVVGVPLMDAASQGLVAGVAAIGGWEMVLKHLLNRKSEPVTE